MSSAVTTAASLDSDRSLTLGDLLGHAATRGFPQRALREDRLPQSILLTGPEGMGKKTLAFALILEPGIIARHVIQFFRNTSQSGGPKGGVSEAPLKHAGF